MGSPTLTFANNLQNVERLDQGLAFGNSPDAIEELWRCIPILVQPGCGESYTIANATALSTLSSFKAVGTSPATAAAPTSTGVTFTFQRLTSLSEPDVTLSHANQHPNNILQADRASRIASMERLLGNTLLTGTGAATTGFLGWQNFTDGATRTDVAFVGPGAAQVLETLYRIDDACATGPLGNRASAFVTTPRGRRNIIRAAQMNGFDLEYRTVHRVRNEVPYIDGRPIITTAADLFDVNNPNQIPLYAVDFSYVFILCTTGTSSSRGIATEEMQLQVQGSTGYLQWFHGACIVRHPSALVRTFITTTLSS